VPNVPEPGTQSHTAVVALVILGVPPFWHSDTHRLPRFSNGDCCTPYAGNLQLQSAFVVVWSVRSEQYPSGAQ
jgi:hypothetical protein